MKKTFEYLYRNCLAKFKYDGDVLCLSVYDKEEKVNYSNIETYYNFLFSEVNLIEEAQIVIDNIKDND